MNHDTIEYHPTIPKEILGAIEPLLSRYSWLIPDWCHLIVVKYFDTEVDKDGRAEDAAISIRLTYHYRQACIEFYSSFLDGTERQRRYQVVHEFLHLYFNIAGDFFVRSLDAIIPEKERGPGYEIAKNEFTNYAESGVQDLAWRLVEFEDQLAAQLGASNLEYNVLLMSEHSKDKSNIYVEPIKPVSDMGRTPSKRSKDKVKLKYPDSVKARDIEQAVRKVSAKRKP